MIRVNGFFTSRTLSAGVVDSEPLGEIHQFPKQNQMGGDVPTHLLCVASNGE